MAGLPHDDPRFEKAVGVGVSLFSHNRWLSPADLEDLAQDVRIALLARGGQAPYLCARGAAVDWFRQLWGRKREDGSYQSSRACGSRRLEMVSLYGEKGEYGKFGGRKGEYAQEADYRNPIARAVSEVPSPDSVVLSREVESVLQRMKPRDRAILVMRHVMEMTMLEIGEEVGVTEARISQLLPRIEERFRYLATLPPAVRAA